MDKTFYTIRTMAKKLGVSEKTIYRMLKENQVPFAVKMGGQWRFRMDAIDSWLNARGANAETGTGKADTTISVHDGLQQGGVFYRIHGKNRDEAISELFATLPYSTAIDHQATKLSIFTRESLASSSMQGIAYMGISDERPVYFTKSMVLLAFLEKPADFKASDGVATEAFFLILPANRAEQAILEMRLIRLAQDGDFLREIKSQPSRKVLLDKIRCREEAIFVNRRKGDKTTARKGPDDTTQPAPPSTPRL